MSTPDDNIPMPPIFGQRTATNKLGELVWFKIDERELAGASSGYLLGELLCTISQLDRAIGYARDSLTMRHHKALPAVRGVFLTTTDPNLVAEYVGWRLRGVDRVLRRLRTGAILPLGDLVAAHAVLNYYDEEIVRMLKVTDELRKLGFPVEAAPIGSS